MQRYNPSEIEPKWQKVWEDQKVNQVTEDPSKVKTYVSGMFPYPSGAGMHTGHAFSYSIVDAIARFHRQLGHNVLNPMGWDTFGLPAENYAIKTGTSPAVATRENIANFKKQFKRMGVSIDWSREINTSDPEYYKWTQWVFTKLFERGLAYQKESLQWWCPVDKTVLANEQVEAGRCWRCGSMVEKKSMKQWFFKITEYADALLEEIEDLDWPQKIKTAQTNWIGRSQGAEVQFTVDGRDDIITVFTTRPDTIFGATFVVLAPEHPLVETLGVGDFAEPLKAYVKEAIKKSEIDRTNDTKEKTGVFTGSYAINPATGERVPIWVADYVLGGYGTGAIMAVPAHDERDLAFAEKYKLPVVDVIGEQTDNEGTLMNSGQFDGTSTFDAREQIVAWLEQQGVGKSQTTYKMRDWLISRQRYWGAPIPIIHCEHCKKRIEQDAHEINFYNQDTWNKILSRKKTIESRADNPEEPERRFADIKVGDYLKFVNKVSGDAQWAKVRTVLRFDNIAELYKDVERTAAICGGEVPLSPAELERMYAELTPGYADKINKNGLIAWEFDLITPGVVPVPEDQLPVVLPEIEDFAPKGDGKSALARAEDWVNTTCPECGKPALRETDTMDGYACSSWYLLRYADPHNADRAWDPDKVNYWNPLDFYIGGDHAVAHLLYVRFWTHVFYDMGLVNFKEPVKKLIYHGYINAEDGSKMSKSKGNVIDPLDVIEQGYGADALRTYVLFMGPIELDATWSSKGIAGVYRFLNRVWTLSQEFMAAEKGEAHDEQAIRVAQHKTIRKVTDDFRRMSFNTAISALMEYTNDLYKFKTDGFSEAVWPEAITALVQMIAPFAPHMADELWSQLGNEGLIQKAGWPTWDESLTIDDIISIAIQVNGKLRGEISVAKDTAAEQVKTLALEHENVAKFVGENEPAKVIYVPGRLVSIVTEA